MLPYIIYLIPRNWGPQQYREWYILFVGGEIGTTTIDLKLFPKSWSKESFPIGGPEVRIGVGAAGDRTAKWPSDSKQRGQSTTPNNPNATQTGKSIPQKRLHLHTAQVSLADCINKARMSLYIHWWNRPLSNYWACWSKQWLGCHWLVRACLNTKILYYDCEQMALEKGTETESTSMQIKQIHSHLLYSEETNGYGRRNAFYYLIWILLYTCIAKLIWWFAGNSIRQPRKRISGMSCPVHIWQHSNLFWRLMPCLR